MDLRIKQIKDAQSLNFFLHEIVLQYLDNVNNLYLGHAIIKILYH